jgi:hypothetical protein
MVDSFGKEYYISREAVIAAVDQESIFNLIHQESVIKVDCIIRKSTEYRKLEFERRGRITVSGFTTYIVSKDDLILSKLVWAKDSRSSLQLGDVRNLLATGYDVDYLRIWAGKLTVAKLLEECLNG